MTVEANQERSMSQPIRIDVSPRSARSDTGAWRTFLMASLLVALTLGAAPAARAQSRVPVCLHQCDAQCSVGLSGHASKAGCIQSCMGPCVEGANRGSNPTYFYGAVYGSDDGTYGYSNNHISQSAAQMRAAAECRARSRGTACRNLTVFWNECVTIVQANRGYDIVGVTASAEERFAQADAEALASCRQQNPGASCKVADRICSVGR
jgi:hypothetical protein